MTDRLCSGHHRLDAILGGGLIANAINLIIGPPGSGKTILAQQYIFHNGTPQAPALFLTTISEPFDKVVRYGQSLAFFDAAAIGEAVIYEDLGPALLEGGLAAVTSKVTELLKDVRPSIVVIDSFKALSALASDPGEFRQFLHELAGRVSTLAISSFWIGEYDQEEATQSPEFAVADAILSLRTRALGERQMRVLQVLKLRGSSFASGEHAYRITSYGLDVFPRLADPKNSSVYAVSDERVATGIPALDQALRDGYWSGSSTMVAGPAGVGKTVMALNFVMEGARRGQACVFATFQEDSAQLVRMAAGLGWTLDGPGVTMFDRAPIDLHIDEWIYDLLDTVDRTKAQRIVIDGLGDLAAVSADVQRFREYLYSLIQRCWHSGISLLMTLETPELFGVERLSQHAVSHLADNVVLLQYVRQKSKMARALTVLKARATRHNTMIREFKIESNGITLGDAIDDAQQFG